MRLSSVSRVHNIELERRRVKGGAQWSDDARSAHHGSPQWSTRHAFIAFPPKHKQKQTTIELGAVKTLTGSYGRERSDCGRKVHEV